MPAAAPAEEGPNATESYTTRRARETADVTPFLFLLIGVSLGLARILSSAIPSHGPMCGGMRVVEPRHCHGRRPAGPRSGQRVGVRTG